MKTLTTSVLNLGLLMGLAVGVAVEPNSMAEPCAAVLKCEALFVYEAGQAVVNAQIIINSQVAKFPECGVKVPNAIPSHLIVKGETRKKSVVTKMSFDDFWKINTDNDKDNDLLILGHCY